MHICNKKKKCQQAKLFLYKNQIQQIPQMTILGLIVQENYKFDVHIKTLKDKLYKDVNILKMLSNIKYGINQDTLRKIIFKRWKMEN